MNIKRDWMIARDNNYGKIQNDIFRVFVFGLHKGKQAI